MKSYHLPSLEKKVRATHTMGNTVRGKIREIMLSAAEDMPKKDSQWMYMTVIRSALGGESEGTNITPQVIQKYEQKFGKGSWEVTIDAYHEHISNVDSFEGVHWSGSPIYCTPPAQERLMNPLSRQQTLTVHFCITSMCCMTIRGSLRHGPRLFGSLVSIQILLERSGIWQGLVCHRGTWITTVWCLNCKSM